DPTEVSLTVLCLDEVGALGPDFAAIHVPVESVSARGAGFLRSVKVVARRLRQLRADVVHTHNPAPHLIGAFAARMAGVPVVVHTKHGRNYPHIRRAVFANRVASWLSDRVVPVSLNVADVARKIEKVPEAKIETIWNGIDLERFQCRDLSRSNGGLRAIH